MVHPARVTGKGHHHVDDLLATLSPAVHGLLIQTSGSTIQGLAIDGFAVGIGITSPGNSPIDGHNVIQGNFVGLAADGNTAAGNVLQGVDVWNSNDNVIGGGTP